MLKGRIWEEVGGGWWVEREREQKQLLLPHKCVQNNPADTAHIPGTWHSPRPAGGLALNCGHPFPPVLGQKRKCNCFAAANVV